MTTMSSQTRWLQMKSTAPRLMSITPMSVAVLQSCGGGEGEKGEGGAMEEGGWWRKVE